MVKKLLISFICIVGILSFSVLYVFADTYSSDVTDDSSISDDLTSLGLDLDNYYNYDYSNYDMVSCIAVAEAYTEDDEVMLFVYLYDPYTNVIPAYISVAEEDITSTDYTNDDFDMDDLDYDYSYYAVKSYTYDSTYMITKAKIDTGLTVDYDSTDYRCWSVNAYKYLSGISTGTGAGSASTASLNLTSVINSYTSYTFDNVFNTCVKYDNSETTYNYDSYVILTNLGVFSFLYDDSDDVSFWKSFFDGETTSVGNGQFFFANFSTDTDLDDILSLSCSYTLREYDYEFSGITDTIDDDTLLSYRYNTLLKFANADLTSNYDNINSYSDYMSLSYDSDNDIKYTADDPHTIFAYDEDGNREVTTFQDDDYSPSFDNICMSASGMITEDEADELGLDYDTFLYDDDGDEYDYSVCFDVQSYSYTDNISSGVYTKQTISADKYELLDNFRIISLCYEYNGVIYNAIANSGSDEGDTNINVPATSDDSSYTFWETIVAFVEIIITAAVSLVSGTFSAATIGSSLLSWFTGYLWWSLVITIICFLSIFLIPSLVFNGVRLLILLFKEICNLLATILKLGLRLFKGLFSFLFVSKD